MATQEAIRLMVNEELDKRRAEKRSGECLCFAIWFVILIIIWIPHLPAPRPAPKYCGVDGVDCDVLCLGPPLHNGHIAQSTDWVFPPTSTPEERIEAVKSGKCHWCPNCWMLHDTRSPTFVGMTINGLPPAPLLNITTTIAP
jgi:hypothetical protein